ncbi:calcium-binding EF-hand domain-containing protein [Cavenderia fasciculata]|uniref:Calcium-binding EF-hand domain-containing protein n=1 Tax=Cavenderia fasciculata TaxID=261658 RepID=F4PVW5_CACFS|nr:calcium-binding EF-hand domain-containing protein [Cavenderia fasciculata]EGG20129.1 calcium-binding EF-hand domain-containing protein [Cavenderia fasciculata]|eukprot:XP_004367112.1 calcium-binding EF-hand domain-containing protein [Cavenderia fasciculata]
MGVNKSTLRTEEIEEVQQITGVFSQKEIKRLFKRFKRLDKEEKGVINVEDFPGIPELSMNPLLPRLIAIFDVNRDSQLNFAQFVNTLSVFHPNAKKEDKLKLYDINNIGYITKGDIETVLTMMVGNNLLKDQVATIVAETFEDADKGNKGKLSFDDFKNSFQDTMPENLLSIQFSNPYDV